MNQQNSSTKQEKSARKFPRNLALAGALTCIVILAVLVIIRKTGLTYARQDIDGIMVESAEVVGFDVPISSVAIDDAKQNLIVASKKSSKIYVLNLLKDAAESSDFQSRLVGIIDIEFSDGTEPSGFSYVAVSESSAYLVAGTMDGETIIWEADASSETGWSKEGEILSGAHRGFVTSVSISKDGKYVSSSGADSIFLWGQKEESSLDNITWRVVSKEYGAHTGPSVWGVVFGRNETSERESKPMLISVGNDSRARIWKVSEGNESNSLLEQSIYNAQREINSVLFDPVTSAIFLGLNDGQIRVVLEDSFQSLLLKNLSSTSRQSQALEPSIFIESHDNAPIKTFAIPKDLDILVSGSNDKKVKIWSIRDRELLDTFHEHEGWVTTVDISHDGKYIVSGGEDKNVVFRIMSYSP
jgi:WD40 repeat protein